MQTWHDSCTIATIKSAQLAWILHREFGISPYAKYPDVVIGQRYSAQLSYLQAAYFGQTTSDRGDDELLNADRQVGSDVEADQQDASPGRTVKRCGNNV